MNVPTDAEARKILSRFIASHFRNTDKEHARFRIPADPAHDDDLRMSQYIDGVAALRAENERLRNAIEIEREGQRSMARALSEINRLSRLDVAIHLVPSAENERLTAAAREALDVLTRLADSAAYWSDYDVPVGIVAEIDAAKARLAGVLRG